MTPVRKPNAQVGLATGKKLEREQEIYTPQIIVDVCLDVWPEGIALDPCSGPGSIIPAKRKLQGRKLEVPSLKNPNRVIWDGMGMVERWQPRTYINPPYNVLDEWMANWQLEMNLWGPALESIMLCPVRTHRTWWRACAERCHLAVWIDHLQFLGYEDGFPQPLCLLYFGERAAALAGAERAHKLGSPRAFTLECE